MNDLRDGRGWRERFVDGWRWPQSLTVLLPTRESSPESLRGYLAQRESAILTDLTGSEGLHALRILVVPPETDGPIRLIINSVSDDDYLIHLQRVATILAPHLAEVLPKSLATPEKMAATFQDHRLYGNTLYLASQGVSLRQIREEARLREVLREWVKKARVSGELDTMPPEEARLAMKQYVLALDDPTCARVPAAEPRGVLRRRVDFVATFLGFPLIGVLGKDIWLAVQSVANPVRRSCWTVAMFVWYLYAGVFSAVALLGVRLMEFLEPDVLAPPAPEDKIDRLEVIEDSRTKNELTIWFPVKPGFMGRLLMKTVLAGAEHGCRHLWTRGKLAGAQNIHFARLLVADGGRRMLFMSDYEGSFDAYIKHFVGVGGHPRAVIPISSRIHGCPKTRWLYLPQDVVSFRRGWRQMARSYQVQASVRYVAYQSLSANDILNNSVIRDRLFAQNLSPAELEDWMRRI